MTIEGKNGFEKSMSWLYKYKIFLGISITVIFISTITKLKNDLLSWLPLFKCNKTVQADSLPVQSHSSSIQSKIETLGLAIENPLMVRYSIVIRKTCLSEPNFNVLITQCSNVSSYCIATNKHLYFHGNFLGLNLWQH